MRIASQAEISDSKKGSYILHVGVVLCMCAQVLLVGFDPCVHKLWGTFYMCGHWFNLIQKRAQGWAQDQGPSWWVADLRPKRVLKATAQSTFQDFNKK